MSDLVGGSIVWNLDVDDSKLKKGLDNAKSNVESASKSIEKNIDTAKTGVNKLSEAFSNAEGASKAFAGIVATIAAGAAAATGFAIKSASEMENLRINLDVMTGSAENGGKIFKDLYDFAAKTPFETGDLAKATQTMLGFGIPSEKVMDNLKMLGDVSMGNKDKLGSLTLAFSQITSTGRLMGQDLLQLINAGFNPLTIISQKTGKSMSELKDDMAAGSISAEMVTDAFKTATSEGGLFYQGMEKGSKTLSGTWSTLKDSIGMLARQFVGLSSTGEIIKGGLLDKLKDGIKGITDALAYLSTDEGMKKIEDFMNIMKVVTPIVAGAIIGGLVPAFGGLVLAISPLLPFIAIGAAIAAGITLLVIGIKAAIPFFQSFGKGIVDTFGSIVEWFKKLPETISNVWAIITNGIVSFFNGFVSLFTYWIPYGIGFAIGWFQTLPEKIGEFLTQAITNIKQWGINTWNYLKVEVPKWITNIFNWFKELPGKIASGLSTLGSTIKSTFSNAWNTLVSEISSWPGKIWDWGKNIAQSFVDGFKNALKGIAGAFTSGVNDAKRDMEGHSPPKEGPLKEIDKWGFNIGNAWTTGFASSISGLKNLMSAVNFQDMLSLDSSNMSTPNYNYGGGGNTQNITIENVNIKDKGDMDALTRQLGFKLGTI